MQLEKEASFWFDAVLTEEISKPPVSKVTT